MNATLARQLAEREDNDSNDIAHIIGLIAFALNKIKRDTRFSIETHGLSDNVKSWLTENGYAYTENRKDRYITTVISW